MGDMIRFLVENGADAFEMTMGGDTPLQLAQTFLSDDDHPAVEYLMEVMRKGGEGVDLSQKDHSSSADNINEDHIPSLTDEIEETHKTVDDPGVNDEINSNKMEQEHLDVVNDINEDHVSSPLLQNDENDNQKNNEITDE